MKKITTLMMTLMILLASQFSKAQTRIGFTAGATFSSAAINIENVTVSEKTKTGFTAGLVADIPLTKKLIFQPALNFIQKGFKEMDETFSDNVTFNCIEIPLNFLFRSDGFFMGAGPSLTYGLSGKDKYVDKIDPSDSYTDKIKFGSGEDQIKPFEFGANFLTGYQTAGGFLFSVNYNLGLTNIQNSNADNVGTIKSHYFGVRIGYLFGGRKIK